jgi:metallo-beta-lactamase class B
MMTTHKKFGAGILIAAVSVAVMAAQGGRGAGGGRQGGAPADNPAGGFGTQNTLYTMPEAGQGGGAGDPTAEQFAASPEAQAIVANAKRMAGTDLAAEFARFCTWNATAVVAPTTPGETVQVFDNWYYATNGMVGAIIIKTSAGLILLDTLNSEEEAKTIIEAGMRKFGLDPTQIKYVVIGHHHRDHTGGLAYIQRTYNPTVLMGKLDWDVLLAAGGSGLRRGVDVVDGQKLTLGDTTLTLFLLPGHTPTSISGIVPATYQGRTFNILNLTASRFSTYASLAPFARIFDEAKRAKVEAVIQAHPEINMLKTSTVEALRKYPTPGPHPLLVSPEKAARYMDVELECGRARIAANKTALDKARTPDYYRTPDAPAGAGRGDAKGGAK